MGNMIEAGPLDANVVFDPVVVTDKRMFTGDFQSVRSDFMENFQDIRFLFASFDAFQLPF
jgi:hypothetical protein